MNRFREYKGANYPVRTERGPNNPADYGAAIIPPTAIAGLFTLLAAFGTYCHP